MSIEGPGKTLRNALYVTGAVALLALFWAYEHELFAWAKHLVQRRASIDHHSSRGHLSSYNADESIRFELKNTEVPPERVVWLFDGEYYPKCGLAVCDHPVPFDKDKPAAAELPHRVDAFYRIGDDYAPAKVRIMTVNAKLTVSAMIEADRFTVFADLLATPGMRGHWRMVDAALTHLDAGQYQRVLRLTPSDGEKGRLFVGDWSAFTGKVWPKDRDLRDAWVDVRLLDQKGSRLDLSYRLTEVVDNQQRAPNH